MILKRSSIGQLQIRPGLSWHGWKEAGAIVSAFLAGRPGAASKGI